MIKEKSTLLLPRAKASELIRVLAISIDLDPIEFKFSMTNCKADLNGSRRLTFAQFNKLNKLSILSQFPMMMIHNSSSNSIHLCPTLMNYLTLINHPLLHAPIHSHCFRPSHLQMHLFMHSRITNHSRQLPLHQRIRMRNETRRRIPILS